MGKSQKPRRGGGKNLSTPMLREWCGVQPACSQHASCMQDKGRQGADRTPPARHRLRTFVEAPLHAGRSNKWLFLIIKYLLQILKKTGHKCSDTQGTLSKLGSTLVGKAHGHTARGHALVHTCNPRTCPLHALGAPLSEGAGRTRSPSRRWVAPSQPFPHRGRDTLGFHLPMTR